MSTYSPDRNDTFFGSLTRSSTSRSTLVQSNNFYSSFRGTRRDRRSCSSNINRSQFSFKSCLAACCRAKIITVEPVIFLFMFSLYLYEIMFQLYVFNSYAYQKIEQYRNSSTDIERILDSETTVCLSTSLLDELNVTDSCCLGDRVEIQTAILGLIVGITARLPSIVTTLILGSISDRFGRKPAIVVVLIGIILHSSIVLVIVELQLDLRFFILSAGLRGIAGGIAGILTASYSYIADISSKKWLTIRLGVLESMNFIAESLSLIIGGVLINLTHCRFELPAILSLACVVAALPYALILLPESLDRDEKSLLKGEAPTQRRTLGPKALLRGFQIFFGKGYSRFKLWLCLFILFITIANISGSTSVIVLYLLHYPLQWDPIQIGGFMGSSEFVHGLSLILILPILVHSGTKDSVIALVAVFLTCVMDICLGFAEKTWQVFAIGVVQGVDSLVTPALKSIMSKAVDHEDQGALFSFVSAVQVLASVCGYVLYPTIYYHTITLNWYHSPGISFFVMAILYIFAIPFMLVLVALDKQQRSDQDRPSCRERLGPSTSSAPTMAVSVDPGSPTSPETDDDPFNDEYESLLKARTELAVEALDGVSFASRNSELSASWQGSFRSVQ